MQHNTLTVNSRDQIRTYLIGYPYIIHNIHIEKKNIIDKIIINDALGLILNFCANDYNSNSNQIEFTYLSKISPVDLVCKKWNQLIGSKIKQLRVNLRSHNSNIARYEGYNGGYSFDWLADAVQIPAEVQLMGNTININWKNALKILMNLTTNSV